MGPDPSRPSALGREDFKFLMMSSGDFRFNFARCAVDRSPQRGVCAVRSIRGKIIDTFV